MFRPFLVVGIGGSGGKTVRAARQALQFKLDQEGWDGGWPSAWQLIHIDSPTTPDGLEFPAPLLPQEDYLSLVPNGIGYRQVHDKVIQGLSPRDKQEVQRPLPSPAEVKIPIQLGAGKVRAVGRTIALAAMKDIQVKIAAALGKIQSPTANAELAQITQLFGAQVAAPGDPTVVIVSSVAGGSGAGMFIDVAEAVKAAIGGEQWAFQTFSLLFAPDVFEELGESAVAAMVPNAMAAISELTAGFWRQVPTEGTLALYKKNGLNIPQDEKATIGPSFNYVIGRKTGGANPVDFVSQSGMYKAVANSLAAWMTDAVIQVDLSAYAVANFHTDSRMTPDRTRLGTVASAQPLSSLGFSRVSIGTDRFVEYASERLARQTLETLLRQHLVSDGGAKTKTEAQWIEWYANSSEGAFVSDSGLDELTEQNNQVIEALHPDTIELQNKLKGAIQSAVSSGMPKGGHSFDKWVALIVNAFEVNLPLLLDDLAKLRHEKGRAWVEMMPEKILRLVTKTIAQQGLPVTVKLLERLINQTREAAAELLTERTSYLRDASSISHTVSQAMGPASSMNAIPANHPTVAQALYQAELAFHAAAMAELRVGANDLMLDLTDNFLVPLETSLSRSLSVLRTSTASPKLGDNTNNPFNGWPDFSESKVDKRFEPAPNESMLIDVSEFASEFDLLLEQTVSDSNLTASKVVIDQIVSGAFSEDVRKLAENKQWQLLHVRQIWIPKNRHYQVRQTAGQPAIFQFATDHMEYLDFAKKWMKVPGKAFQNYVGQTIAGFLKADGDVALQGSRAKKFAAAVDAAILSADPLVDLDQRLLSAAHGEVKRRAICSGIPIDNSNPIKAGIETTLVANGYNPDKGWFGTGSKAANAKSIEIFTQMETSINPIPMVSLFEPILREWSRSSNDFEGRSNFITWRRGRTLAESIPAHETQWQTMLNGWFIGRLLNLLENDKTDASYRDKGPKLSVWSGPAEGWTQFPFPLYSANIVANIDDLPAAILESLIIAMADCHSTGSLQPLAPYSRLFDLGGGDQGHWDELSRWILRGEVQPGAPTPNSDRAGNAGMSPAERQESCASYLESLQAKFREKMVAQDSHSDSRTYPVVWEIRREIEYALEACVRAVRSIEPEEEL